MLPIDFVAFFCIHFNIFVIILQSHFLPSFFTLFLHFGSLKFWFVKEREERADPTISLHGLEGSQRPFFGEYERVTWHDVPQPYWALGELLIWRFRGDSGTFP